jgi:hypothetical protein
LAPLKPIYAVHKNGQGIFLHCNIKSNSACLGQPRRLPIGNHKPVRISCSQALGDASGASASSKIKFGAVRALFPMDHHFISSRRNGRFAPVANRYLAKRDRANGYCCIFAALD